MKNLFVFLCFGLIFGKINPNEKYSAVLQNSTWILEKGDHGIAWAIFDTTKFKSTGWYELNVVTNPKYSDDLQAFAAGFVEGALTVDQTYQNFKNLAGGENFVVNPTIRQFILDNDKWMTEQIKANPTNEYWIQVGLVLSQFDGFVTGFNSFASSHKQKSRFQLLLLQLSSGDLGDLQAAYPGTSTTSGSENTNFDREKLKPSLNHCSALIKPTPDGTELFASHVTWASFSSMLRCYKHYDFYFNTASTQATGISFSGYPGNLESSDDFYLTSQNLMITETTNGVLNMSLYNYLTPQSIFYWIRVNVASRMSSTGQEWAQYYSQYNSGTYCNQFMIVDYKLFPVQNRVSLKNNIKNRVGIDDVGVIDESRVKNGVSFEANTLWVIENVPGFVQMADVTPVLQQQGYWASYNVPYFPFIFNISGFLEYENKYGNTYSYTQCPRANIFRRDQHTVTDLKSMKAIMRYNEYQTDSLSLEDSCNGISARCDLNEPWKCNNTAAVGCDYDAFGGLDCKITSNKFSVSRQAFAVCGPTWESQPPFAWTNQWKDVPHEGQPSVFAFDFEVMKPKYSQN